MKPDAVDDFNPVVVVPTYNNAATLVGVLGRIERLGLSMIVVDDGASDDTPAILKKWSNQDHAVSAEVLTHEINQGKAAAMMTGFTHAARLGHTHAVTMDTDGQLSPEDIPAMLAAAKDSPDALILGRRSTTTPGLPKSNLVGWYTSGLGVWVETGVSLIDTQCGLRAYPLKLFDVVQCRVGRFGFEAEIIARALWSGFSVVEVPVNCIYPPHDDRVSHFRPVKDGAKGFFMHWALAIRKLIPCPVPRITVNRSKDNDGKVALTGLRAWQHWLSPTVSWRQLRSGRLSQLIMTADIGFGAFLACMTLGWWVLPALIYGSKRLHHNLWASALGAALAIPPVGTVLVKASITLGYLATHLGLPDFSLADPSQSAMIEVMRTFPLSWSMGGIVIGCLLHWLIIAALMHLLRYLPENHRVESMKYM